MTSQLGMDSASTTLDERLQIVGGIFQSVGISAVTWGPDALAHHAIQTPKTRNDLILPNEDFLRAAEALRLHNFVTLDPIPGSPHHLDGLETYAAQYAYPPEITERLGTDITVALFPASLVGWKLVYIPVMDAQDKGSFTTSLAIQKIPIPVDADVEHSFIQLSRSSSVQNSITSDDDSSVSTVRAETDDEYVVVQSYAGVEVRPVPMSTPMERGNGPPVATSSCDIVDMKPEPGTGAVEMLPGHKMIEKTDGQLIMLEKGIYVPRISGLKESTEGAVEFMKRDGAGGSKFSKVLEGWNGLLAGRDGI